ncbi:MAG: metal-binding protein [Persephonella sp.]|nr:MAG: metal-binding protein [Persephonella sp.]
MPSGNTHEFFNMVSLPVVLTALQPEGLLPFIAGYLFSTFYLSPDMDLPHSKPSKRWGSLKIIWVPYQSFVSHRSLISHSPVISSVIRLLYLLLPLFLTILIIFKVIDEVFFEGGLSVILQQDIGILNIETEIFFKNLIFYFAYGVIIGDLLHLLLDFSVSFLKGMKKRINKKFKFLKI